MFIYIYVHTCTHAHTHIHTYVRTYIHVDAHISFLVSVHSCDMLKCIQCCKYRKTDLDSHSCLRWNTEMIPNMLTCVLQIRSTSLYHNHLQSSAIIYNHLQSSAIIYNHHILQHFAAFYNHCSDPGVLWNCVAASLCHASGQPGACHLASRDPGGDERNLFWFAVQNIREHQTKPNHVKYP